MKYKLITYIAGVVIFLSLFLIFFVATNLFPYLFMDMPRWLITILMPIHPLLTLSIPCLIGFLLSRLFVRWYQKRKNINVRWYPKNRTIIYVFITLYLITAIAGSPVVQSQNTNWAIDEYKEMRDSGDRRVWNVHPSIATHLSVPILPFIVLSYHSYQLTGLYGWGGWDIQLWYVYGVRRIFSVPVWLS